MAEREFIARVDGKGSDDGASPYLRIVSVQGLRSW
jgi:hypothetical protein